MAVLEMEEALEDEISSLVHETEGLPTADRRKNAFNKNNHKHSRKGQQDSKVLGRNSNFTTRNVCLLGLLAAMMGIFLKNILPLLDQTTDDTFRVSHGNFHSNTLGRPPSAGSSSSSSSSSGSTTTTTTTTTGESEWFLPVSNVGHAIPSVTEHNIENLVGHYFHDEHNSPFASTMFDKPKEELDKIQTEYLEKMEQVRKEWGAWQFQDPSPGKQRHVPNFESVDYRDLKNSDMPSSAWQKDETYIREFVKEAKALVNRVLEGVYAEYGHPSKKADGTVLTEEEKKARHELFEVTIIDDHPIDKKTRQEMKGIAYLTSNGWDGLVSKLLHAMVTNDMFYMVLGGHSSAAGHGNNFLQTQAMQFHHLMEPIFDKLGMTLISKNMAMGGLGTAHSSMAGGGIYGEADLMWWDSSMTEKGGGACDLFNKQAILSGERVPVLLTTFPEELYKESNGTAWFGDIIVREGTKNNIVPPSTDRKQIRNLPWASQGVNCPKNIELCRTYHSECWYPRSDYTPVTKQLDTMPGRASWHPPDPTHKWNGRVVSLIVLQALEVALQVWETVMDHHASTTPDKTIDPAHLPMPEQLWHVGHKYKQIQATLRTNPNNDQSSCAQWLKDYPSRICQVAMNGATSWTPRNRNFDLASLAKPAPNNHTLPPLPPQVYSAIDVAMPSFQIPKEHVDAHAIAIATNIPTTATATDTATDTNTTTNTTRSLRQSPPPPPQQQQQQSSSHNIPRSVHQHAPIPSTSNRKLEEAVVPGLGWDLLVETTGYCDGSSNSHCGRREKDTCLNYAHNDGRTDIVGDGLSGWIVFTLDNLREGLVLGRFEWWRIRDVPATKTWTEINNGQIPPYTNNNNNNNSTQRHLQQHKPTVYQHPNEEQQNRELKAKIPEYPNDFKCEIAIDGTIVKTFNKDEFMKYAAEITHNVAVWPLYDNVDMAKNSIEGKTVELGIRVTSASNPRAACLGISHIYWA